MLRGTVISHVAMCQAEGISLQKGMNFRVRGRHSVILMFVRRGAPYANRVEDDGRVLIYEGHDVPRLPDGPRYSVRGVRVTERRPQGAHTHQFLKVLQLTASLAGDGPIPVS
jgi:hypothetical protein